MTSAVDVAQRIGPGLSWAARMLVVAISVLALISFGAQVYFFPFLVPAQWLAARHSDRLGRWLFTLLAGLLSAEVGWMIGYELAAELAVVIGVATGVVMGTLFLRTTPTPLPVLGPTPPLQPPRGTRQRRR